MQLFKFFAVLTAFLALSACDLFQSQNTSSSTELTEVISSSSSSVSSSNESSLISAKIVATVAELPLCNTEVIGYLFYILETKEFKVCTVSGFMVVDIQGPQGEQGLQGLPGEIGAQGDQGLQGIAGDAGAQGDQGLQGIAGDTGVQGDQGLQGVAGDTGVQGAQGLQGVVGETGAQGDQGLQGVAGDTGVQGDQGLQGVAGDTGAQGDQGLQGIQGNDGTPGSQGDQGAAGADGSSCMVIDNGDGTHTLACENGSSMILRDGSTGPGGITLSGYGIPDSTLGEDGNKYLDLDMLMSFEKSGGEWIILNTSFNLDIVSLEYLLLAGASTLNVLNSGATYLELQIAGFTDFTGVFEEFTDERDGETYNWVRIGTQIWMAEDLNYSGGNDSGDKTFEVGYCHGGNGNDVDFDDHSDNANCDTYGRLYSWATALDIDPKYNTELLSNYGIQQGLCPTGWHIPNSMEWETLVVFVGGGSPVEYGYEFRFPNGGVYLKSTQTWDGKRSEKDPHGFSGMANGYSRITPSFATYQDLSHSGGWHTTTERGEVHDVIYSFHRSSDDTFRFDNGSKINANAVRCIQDIAE